MSLVADLRPRLVAWGCALRDRLGPAAWARPAKRVGRTPTSAERPASSAAINNTLGLSALRGAIAASATAGRGPPDASSSSTALRSRPSMPGGPLRRARRASGPRRRRGLRCQASRSASTLWGWRASATSRQDCSTSGRSSTSSQTSSWQSSQSCSSSRDPRAPSEARSSASCPSATGAVTCATVLGLPADPAGARLVAPHFHAYRRHTAMLAGERAAVADLLCRERQRDGISQCAPVGIRPRRHAWIPRWRPRDRQAGEPRQRGARGPLRATSGRSATPASWRSGWRRYQGWWSTACSRLPQGGAHHLPG